MLNDGGDDAQAMNRGIIFLAAASMASPALACGPMRTVYFGSWKAASDQHGCFAQRIDASPFVTVQFDKGQTEFVIQYRNLNELNSPRHMIMTTDTGHEFKMVARYGEKKGKPAIFAAVEGRDTTGTVRSLQAAGAVRFYRVSETGSGERFHLMTFESDSGFEQAIDRALACIRSLG